MTIKSSKSSFQQASSMVDIYQRSINYLRVSITDRCNLKCIYCGNSKNIPKFSHDDILTYEEILHIIKVATTIGISKVRITGGEPLVRRGVTDFLCQLTSIPALEDVSMTTNGVFLSSNIEKILLAGIKRINISLDTLNREKFVSITGFDRLSEVLNGIKIVEQAGMNPIKINVVIMKGINDDEISDFGRLSIEKPYHIRFIEYMPLGKSVQDHNSMFMPYSEIEKKLLDLGKLTPVINTKNDGPAKRYKWENGAGEIGFIHPITQHFCDSCNRFRLNAVGHLRPCLLSDSFVDIKPTLRNKSLINDEHIKQCFYQALSMKPKAHLSVAECDSFGFPVRMSAIGG